MLFIVLAAFTGLMAFVNPATLILTALSIFAAVKVDFFAGRNEPAGKKPVYRWVWLWVVAIFVGTVAFSVIGVSNLDATSSLDRGVSEIARTEESEESEPETEGEDADGFGQEPAAEEAAPVEAPAPEPEPEPVQQEPELQTESVQEDPEPVVEPEPAPEPVQTAPVTPIDPNPQPAAEQETIEQPVRAVQSVSQEYVLNTNTGKFHYPNCSSVGRMSSNNRRDFVGTREEVIAMGYQPCGRCHP